MDSSTDKSLFVAGSVIGGRYEVIDSLGSGGMGTVVRVVDRALNDEVVALKLLYPHMAKDQTSFARFRNEVLIARKLAHPNIVRLYDFGAAGQGYYYISMEYVEGGSLGGRIYGPREQRPQFQECLEILYEICQGLSCAHSHGVMHRDLKPDNILLTTSSVVKISDFGLARSTTVERGLTATGDTVGTPYYMAPEQLKGARLDQRVDLYALGIMAFEMVVGRRPFFHESYISLAHMHFSQPIPKFAGPESGIPEWFQQFVERCAAKKPDDRFASAEEAAMILADHMGDSGNSDVARRPAVLSFYGEQRTKTRPAIKKRIGVWFLTTLALALVFVGIVLMVRASDTLKSFTRRQLLSVEHVTGISATALKEILHCNIGEADFFPSVVNGRKEVVEDLLLSGFSANTVDAQGLSGLHYAAKNNREDIAELLLRNGASVDLEDSSGATPLTIAAKNGSNDVGRVLLAANARYSHVDSQGITPLMYAAESGNLQLVQRLLEAGALINAVDHEGRSAIMHALEVGKSQVAVTLAREPGFDHNSRDAKGNTALHYACQQANYPAIEALLAVGASAGAKNLANKTPADVAPSKESEKVKTLLSANRVLTDTTIRTSRAAPKQVRLLAQESARRVHAEWFGSTLGASITQEVWNKSSDTANDVEVVLVTKDSTLTFKGPRTIKGNTKQTYVLSSSKISRADAEKSNAVEVRCKNCYRK